MSDLVKRLRLELDHEAADAIERLEAENAKLRIVVSELAVHRTAEQLAKLGGGSLIHQQHREYMEGLGAPSNVKRGRLRL